MPEPATIRDVPSSATAGRERRSSKRSSSSRGDHRQVESLVRTLAAALLAQSPSAWAARRRDDTPAQRGVLIGLAVYMFTSSLIDLHAFVNDIVGAASVPSITLRVILGAVIVWLIPPRRTPARLSANAPATG